MNTLKKLTSLTLLFVFILASVTSVFAGEIYIDGQLCYGYNDDYMVFSDYKATINKILAYAQKGDHQQVNKIYTEELIPLEIHYGSIDDYSELFDDLGFVEAKCEFDKETGTVIKVLNDAELLAIPAFIDGVPVTAIAEGAVCDKKEMVMFGIPPFVETIDKVIIKNCPYFEAIDAFQTSFDALFFENCPSYDTSFVYLYEDSTISHAISTSSVDENLHRHVTLGMGFVIDSGVIKGDEKGNYNWENYLTRTEATIMILRLMGLESEVPAFAKKSCPFTDVPDWAKGYINLALEKNIVKGRSENYFGSSEICSFKDYLTMLFRLTELSEGKDFSWQTVVDDYKNALYDLDEKVSLGMTMPSDYYNESGLDYRAHADEITSYFNKGGKFDRQCASVVLYYMLNITAGENGLSLADVLAGKYGMDDFVLYNYYVRRSGKALTEDFGYIHPSLRHSYFDNEKLIGYLRKFYKAGNIHTANPEIKAFSESLTSGMTSEYEKAKTVSQWIAEHIFYDYDYYEGRKNEVFISPEDVFNHRFSVCEGYANLTREMLTAIGIECYKVSSSNHAWNVAVIDEKPILIDSTWNSSLAYECEKFRSSKSSDSNSYLIKNTTEPGVEWDNLYFDSDKEDFYNHTSHHPLRMPRLMASKVWSY